MEDGSIKFYSSEYAKPALTSDLLEETGVIIHYNENHDPTNGQFTSGPGGPVSKKTTGSVKKATVKKEGFLKRVKSKRKAKKLYKSRVETLKRARAKKAENASKREEQAKSKEDITKSKDIEAMLKNVDLFSTQEINDMLNRLGAESRLMEAVSKQREANKTTGQKIADKVKRNLKEKAEQIGSNIVKNGSEALFKEGVKRLTANADPQVRKTLDQIFSIQRNEKSKVDISDAALRKMNENLSKYDTKYIQEIIGRYNSEKAFREMVNNLHKKKE